MKAGKDQRVKYNVSAKEAFNLVLRYARKRILEQIKSVALIIIYMVLFQVLVLKIPLYDSVLLGVGFTMVIFGLAFFMEGLLLGLMPLGEVLGIRLPAKTNLATILIIGFILGVGATFAEPAIGALKMAGASINAWSSPLLFLFLNRFSHYLVYAIGVGVGFAMIFGILRFLYGWSLKPFIYICVPILLAISLYAYFDPNLNRLLGLAWDCGAITTGPVTVPLILAMGLGISRVSKRSGKNDGSGFGVVTLASLFPIMAVIITGLAVSPKVQVPMSEKDFFAYENKANASFILGGEDKLKGYALCQTTYDNYLPLFANDEAQYQEFCNSLVQDKDKRLQVFGSENVFEGWLLAQEDHDLKLRYYGSDAKMEQALERHNGKGIADFNPLDKVKKHSRDAAQAIIPLSAFLILVMFLVLRERLPRADEIILGLVFALLGMAIFSGGIEMGLAKIGDQVGANLPASYTRIELPTERITIKGFSDDLVNEAIMPDGRIQQFFYFHHKDDYLRIPYQADKHNRELGIYEHIPSRGPLFGATDMNLAGLLVVLLFAFVMGYGATLAEPALNALGMAVEDITVGTFKKKLLIQTVAVGVGFGIALGMAKIIWELPLFWMLAPPYLLLLFLSAISSEDFVNIGWDSAGVTTGPITVPLVLALGLGVGSQLGVAEGFGILSMASVCPIISVLTVGLVTNYRRKAALRAFAREESTALGVES